MYNAFRSQIHSTCIVMQSCFTFTMEVGLRWDILKQSFIKCVIQDFIVFTNLSVTYLPCLDVTLLLFILPWNTGLCGERAHIHKLTTHRLSLQWCFYHSSCTPGVILGLFSTMAPTWQPEMLLFISLGLSWITGRWKHF